VDQAPAIYVGEGRVHHSGLLCRGETTSADGNPWVFLPVPKRTRPPTGDGPWQCGVTSTSPVPAPSPASCPRNDNRLGGLWWWQFSSDCFPKWPFARLHGISRLLTSAPTSVSPFCASLLMIPDAQLPAAYSGTGLNRPASGLVLVSAPRLFRSVQPTQSRMTSSRG